MAAVALPYLPTEDLQTFVATIFWCWCGVAHIICPNIVCYFQFVIGAEMIRGAGQDVPTLNPREQVRLAEKMHHGAHKLIITTLFYSVSFPPRTSYFWKHTRSSFNICFSRLCPLSGGRILRDRIHAGGQSVRIGGHRELVHDPELSDGGAGPGPESTS